MRYTAPFSNEEVRTDGVGAANLDGRCALYERVSIDRRICEYAASVACACPPCDRGGRYRGRFSRREAARRGALSIARGCRQHGRFDELFHGVRGALGSELGRS
jgi:hypothetical protein